MRSAMGIQLAEVELEPWMPVLHEPAQPPKIGVGLRGEHRLVVHHIAAHGLREAHSVPTRFDQATPEIKVLPPARDVEISAHVLPGGAAHQCHGIDVVAVQESFTLPERDAV